MAKLQVYPQPIVPSSAGFSGGPLTPGGPGDLSDRLPPEDPRSGMGLGTGGTPGGPTNLSDRVPPEDPRSGMSLGTVLTPSGPGNLSDRLPPGDPRSGMLDQFTSPASSAGPAPFGPVDPQSAIHGRLDLAVEKALALGDTAAVPPPAIDRIATPQKYYGWVENATSQLTLFLAPDGIYAQRSRPDGSEHWQYLGPA